MRTISTSEAGVVVDWGTMPYDQVVKTITILLDSVSHHVACHVEENEGTTYLDAEDENGDMAGYGWCVQQVD